MRALAAIVAVAGVLLLCGCAGTTATSSGTQVVAAENFWGSIASQLAGQKANIQSIIVNPAQDPHSYEPTAQDARTLATAKLAIVNGIGYDPWVPRLLAANPVPGRVVLNVGNLLGLQDGDNPHRWYDPQDVLEVAAAITRDLKRLEPKDAGYLTAQLAKFEHQGLAQYDAEIARIKAHYSGVPVGASESIFALQAPALGLNLITPATFMKAVGEGTDVSAQDVLTVSNQITHHQLKVWVYNSQNATPVVQRMTALARDAKIPVVTITETLDPASDSFQQWQVAQLQRLALALAQATPK